MGSSLSCCFGGRQADLTTTPSGSAAPTNAASAAAPAASAAALATPTTSKPTLAATDDRAAMRENALRAAEERQKAQARRGVPEGPKATKSAGDEGAKIENWMN
mmetsp:Transcript_3761/g.9818  ORF Transcript_3761/g.9818 Transcript_3761/m.9818 type:complete len:104 (-) Transcript_3761:404-715(-)